MLAFKAIFSNTNRIHCMLDLAMFTILHSYQLKLGWYIRLISYTSSFVQFLQVFN